MAERIGVVGTGLSGLLLSCHLAENGFAVDLIGPDIKAQDDKRTTAILQPGIALLKDLGLWLDCAHDATPLSIMELVDGNKQHIFRATEVNHAEFGFNISNAALKSALLKKIKSHSSIAWHKDLLQSAKRTTQGWSLHTKAKKINVQLLIGADGRNSVVRQAAEIAIDEKDEDQTALVTVVKAAIPHRNTSVEWYRAGGPLTLVPMPDNHLAVVWCETSGTAQQLMSQPLTTLGRSLADATNKRFGALTLLQPPQAWPIRPMKAQRMIALEIALIGEAAHSLSPIGAQGLNTSVQDLLALCDVLTTGRDLGLSVADHTMLSRYQRKRLNDITARYHGSNALNDMIRAQSLALRMIRNLSLKLVDLQPMRQAAMRFGMGAIKGETA